MSRAVPVLQQLGFSEYEARAYVTLLERSPLTGYELAKLSGIPRPNVYAVLQKLKDRSVIAQIETPTGTCYAPVPPDELIERLGSRFQAALSAAQQTLEEVQQPPEQGYVWNLQGYQAMLEHARSLVGAAQTELLLALLPQEAAALADVVLEASQRGVSISTLCLQACPHECGACRGAIGRYNLGPQDTTRWLIVVQDQSEMLCAAIEGHGRAQGMRSRQPMVVQLAAWHVRNCVALGAILSDSGERLEPLLSPATQTLLASLGPLGQPGGWLTYLRHLLHSTQN